MSCEPSASDLPQGRSCTIHLMVCVRWVQYQVHTFRTTHLVSMQALTQLVYRVLVVQAAVVMGYRMNADTGCQSIHDLIEAHSESGSMHPAMPARLLPFLWRACILQRQVLNQSLVRQPDAPSHCDKQAASSMVSPASSTQLQPVFAMHDRLWPS